MTKQMENPKPRGEFPYFGGENPYIIQIDLAFQEILLNFATMKKIYLIIIITTMAHGFAAVSPSVFRKSR